jgi:carboxylesterase
VAWTLERPERIGPDLIRAATGGVPRVIEYFQNERYRPFALEHADVAPDRLGVMLVHGFTGTPADMRPLADELHTRGADCHGLLHPGMAIDIANLSKMTAEVWRSSALKHWERHVARYRRSVLIGYSMGGAAAIQMAAHHPPDLVVLLAPFSRINDRRAVFLPVARHLLKEFRLLSQLDFDDPWVRDWFKVTLPDVDLDDPEMRRVIREETGIAAPVIDELRKFGAVGRREASKVTAPVVVIQGHDDTVVNPRDTRALINRFPRLQAYHEIPGDHLLPMAGAAAWPETRSLVLHEVHQLLTAWAGFDEM